MQITIEENLATKIAQLAKFEHKSLEVFVQETLTEVVSKNDRKRTDAEKVERFIESYRKLPQKPEEYEIWQDEQVWEDE